ncbi:MAG TPA: sulfate ABC transporter substrate-binding protein [Pyrinomonadaceae bacterium]|nr:sulfate ABC transporter substrate-binding protein [Pyrinomonadaceae bacterium]
MRKLGILVLITSFFLTACLPGPTSKHGNRSITIYAFSIMKESLERDIVPAFKERWKQQHGEDVSFSYSFAGSETVTNQILQGAPADIAILSIELDVQRLIKAGFVSQDWFATPQRGIVNKTPFVILVRAGNPLGITDFADLGKPGVKLIHPDPVSSGGAQWSILSIYGSELKKSEMESGQQDKVRALNTLKSVWGNVFVTPESARAARTTFETGYGDALITYELEALLMKQAGAPVEIVVPKATIFSEHPGVVIERNVTADERDVVNAFRNFLWSEEAQKAFVKNNFRSSTNDALNEANPHLVKIEMPFTVHYFGGWEKASPEIIDGVFRDQVKK